jgi:phytoene synthase
MSGVSARVTRKSGTSFADAFRVLPAAKRRAIYALYAFCRDVDDCVDEENGTGERGLREWEGEVARCFAGHPVSQLGGELADAIARFRLPRRCFDDIIAGCRMDLTTTRYATFADLRVYCERVASAVGLASIEIFGYRDPGTRDYAVELGLALQLTNILRDVAADAERQRIYIPLEDLARFGVSEETLLAAPRDGAKPSGPFRALLAFQADRARSHYARAAALLPPGDRRSMVSAEIMASVYRATLERLCGLGFPLRPRVRLSRGRRAWIAARTWWTVRRAP